MQKLDILVEALDRDEPVDLSSLPPPPGQCSHFKAILNLNVFDLLFFITQTLQPDFFTKHILL